jgi:pimeloyl-ACP methyl ester carboxylesterase
MSTVVSSDGTTIAYDRIGAGPPVVMVSPAFSHRAFDPKAAELAAFLAARFTVFTYDRRGRGDSGDTAPYAVEREIEDLAAVIGGAGGSARVYGMSSGAVLALRAAAYGLPISRLALYEAPLVVDDSRPPRPADFPARLEALLAAGRRGDAVELFMTQAVHVPAEMVAQMRQAPIWPAFEEVAHTLAYDTAIMADVMTGDPSALKPWSSVMIPTLVVDGGASPVWMHHAALALADILPDARCLTLEGQTHDVAPEVLGAVLAEFFA